jgi:hypothetical protein
LIPDLKIVVPEQNNSDTPSIVSPDKYHDLNLFVRLICNKMDEEGQGSLSEIKLTWEKLGLAKSQINRKVLMFSMSHYSGRFIAWMRLPRFPTSTRIR